ncbi:AIPR family protein [Nostoc sphaeroides CHAB 2801]|uniref:AIPR family protein n=1 Tax=Nostoc sphaeroides TaxID=446679 RepID=UPI001E33998E|nr:AIPR family protein [Nostoc sphaeroides]MCC5633658.1 AIPR family protein [Nostoc sphaeroides CHAB 2801]
MPKTWNLKIDNYFLAFPNCMIATAHVDSFPIDLPLEPNIREPNRKSATYRQIFDSLTTQPEKFFSRHSGIVLSANIVKSSKTSLELEVKEASEGGSDGIINGAHTVLAFEQAKNYKYDLTQARVKVTIHIGLAEDFLQQLWTNSFRKYLVSEKTAGNTVGTKISRNQEIWESLYISAQSYLNQHLVKMVNSSKSESEAKVTQGRKGRVQAGKK